MAGGMRASEGVMCCSSIVATRYVEFEDNECMMGVFFVK